jgi:dephospho-CoA kinase
MLKVGLTGGVASGKTVISQIWKEEGAYLIDADQIARELVQPDTDIWKELVRIFGKEILKRNGSIHRRKLGSRVFSDPEKRNLLNQILHPRIIGEMNRRAREIGQKDPEAIVVIDAALLVETGYYREMDQVIVVTATEAQQIERLRSRTGLKEKEARKILSSQIATEERVRIADFVIRNEGSLEETRRRAEEVFQELKRMASQKKKRLSM